VRTAIMLFTRDLRVHDNPALNAVVATFDQVVPMFVLDRAITAPENRARFLSESLNDLRNSLRRLGSDLVIRAGDTTAEVIRAAGEHDAIAVALADDVSGFAQRRLARLQRECDNHRIGVKTFPGATVVAPGDVTPSAGGSLYKVFTPYHRAWLAKRWRELVVTPRRISSPPLKPIGAVPPATASRHWTGGETEALRRLAAWKRRAQGYAEGHDDMAADRTSRLSPYLHFGCVSPLRLATSGMPDAYVRQLCWRDFYAQLLAGFPKLATANFRESASDEWSYDTKALERWKQGETGVDIVDAGMRQLLEEGWLHNRARLITASYLTKTLGIDWRAGGDWFMEQLVDGDVASNYGNWQWVAGTGTDTKAYRRFSPQRQAERYDPDGSYVRRHLATITSIPSR
jgi:deoxyribodipyrimidine photo-lyase